MITHPSAPLATARPRPRWRSGRPKPLVIALVTVLVLASLGVGLFGAYRYIWAFWVYRGFSPPHEPTTVRVVSRSGVHTVKVLHGDLQQITVSSAAIGNEKISVLVYLPAGYDADSHRRYPTLYLLHGRPGNAKQFINVADVGGTEDTLVAEHKINPMIIVMPESSPVSNGISGFISPDNEWANGLEANGQWETFVARDVVDAVDATYRTLPEGSARALGGLSEGGYAAVNIGLHHPGEFAVLESWSGYMRAARIKALFGNGLQLTSYNSPLTEINAVAPQLRADHTYIWMYTGTKDYDIASNEAMAQKMAALGVAGKFMTVPGEHNWALWRAMVPASLEVASSHMAPPTPASRP